MKRSLLGLLVSLAIAAPHAPVHAQVQVPQPGPNDPVRQYLGCDSEPGLLYSCYLLTGFVDLSQPTFFVRSFYITEFTHLLQADPTVTDAVVLRPTNLAIPGQYEVSYGEDGFYGAPAARAYGPLTPPPNMMLTVNTTLVACIPPDVSCRVHQQSVYLTMTPEPASAVLVAAGLAGVLGMAWRRRRGSAAI